MNDKELLDKIKAREELERRGFMRKRCDLCGGTGRTYRTFNPCVACSGRGYHWQGPLTR